MAITDLPPLIENMEVLEASLFPPIGGISTTRDQGGVEGGNQDGGPGVVGTSKTGDGVFGQGGHNGVVGRSKAGNHSGVWADNTAGGHGVTGTSDAPDGVSAYGRGGRVGVYGASPGDDGKHPEAQGGLAGFFAGNVAVTGDITFTNATVRGDITLPNADCAEDFDIAHEASAEPGTVMVLDDEGSLRESYQGYDKRVAGIISGAGDYRPGIVFDKQQTSTRRLPVALVGKVYCKVDAQYGAVKPGDLLTTSPTLGHAMRADDPLKAFGAIIGGRGRSRS